MEMTFCWSVKLKTHANFYGCLLFFLLFVDVFVVWVFNLCTTLLFICQFLPVIIPDVSVYVVAKGVCVCSFLKSTVAPLCSNIFVMVDWVLKIK